MKILLKEINKSLEINLSNLKRKIFPKLLLIIIMEELIIMEN